jgi:hypothetical protein
MLLVAQIRDFEKPNISKEEQIRRLQEQIREFKESEHALEKKEREFWKL